MSEDNATPSNAQSSSCIFMMHGEQLLLLRDMFALQQIDVCLVDTCMTELIEDAWKPWARRLRPHTKHISGRLILYAPSYLFPDPDNHSSMRALLTTQLQAICDIAVTLDADAVLIPLEAGLACFAERIRHYLTPLHQRLSDQGMTLIVHAGCGSNPDDLSTIINGYEPAIMLSTELGTHGTYQLRGAELPHALHPIPIMGPFDEVAHYRTTLTAWQELFTAARIEVADASEKSDDTTTDATAD